MRRKTHLPDWRLLEWDGSLIFSVVNWPSAKRISGWKLVLVQVAGLWGSVLAEEVGHEEKRASLPPPPASRLVDAARVFGPNERRAIEADAASMPQIVYVVTMESAVGIDAGDYASHLAKAWIPEGAMAPRGAVMVLEFSAHSERPVLGFSGPWTENAAAAKVAFDKLAATDAAAGVRAALGVLGGHPPLGVERNSVHRGSTATGIAGAFFVLTTMFFVYQRVKEHLELRAKREMEMAAGSRRGGG